jgi:two-component system NtrC family sensor kinase
MAFVMTKKQSAQIKTPPHTSRKIRVLFVDDEPAALKAMERTLQALDFELRAASCSEDAIKIIQSGFRPALVISDFRMPGDDGLHLLRWIKDRIPESKRIMISGYADRSRVEQALKEGIVHIFLTKPWEIDTFAQTVEDVLSDYHEETPGMSVEDELETLVQERTRQLEAAKKAWEEVFDVFASPLAVVREDFRIERANLAYADAADAKIQHVPGGLCYETLFGRDAPCLACPITANSENKEACEISDEQNDRVYEVTSYLFGEEQANGEMARYVALYKDVTAKRQLERQLFQTEKMAALGVLSGEIAHEINNPVGIILSFSQLALRTESAPIEGELKEFLEEILGSARRCKSIIRNLLSFSRPSMVGETEVLDVPDLINRTLEIAAGSLRSASVSIDAEYSDSLPEAKGWPDQIQQVFLNLITNAVHALEEQEGERWIAIRTKKGRFLGTRSLLVTIADNGPGIPPGKISRVFEPFFSTKAAGKGTGLGLSICYRIISEHGGTIEVDNQPGSGAMFRIYLPSYE